MSVLLNIQSSLQRRIAIKVLSQDCSSGPCERNWSTWALFHTKKRNRLSTSQLERLVYCHCNLRLLEQKGNSIEAQQVNPDTIDINKCLDIPDIPQEERDIYSMLYEEITAPSHATRSRQSQRASTSDAPPPDDDTFEESSGVSGSEEDGDGAEDEPEDEDED